MLWFLRMVSKLEPNRVQATEGEQKKYLKAKIKPVDSFDFEIKLDSSLQCTKVNTTKST